MIDKSRALMQQRTLAYMGSATREAYDTYPRLHAEDRENATARSTPTTTSRRRVTTTRADRPAPFHPSCPVPAATKARCDEWPGSRERPPRPIG